MVVAVSDAAGQVWRPLARLGEGWCPLPWHDRMLSLPQRPFTVVRGLCEACGLEWFALAGDEEAELRMISAYLRVMGSDGLVYTAGWTFLVSMVEAMAFGGELMEAKVATIHQEVASAMVLGGAVPA